MTADEFRAFALQWGGALESQHMRHPDFRVGGKIFAALTADGLRGMVRLTPDQQAAMVKLAPKTFAPATGAWGRQGCTMVTLARAPKALVAEVIAAAWRQVAPSAAGTIARHSPATPTPGQGRRQRAARKGARRKSS